jgi:hypothetical protein
MKHILNLDGRFGTAIVFFCLAAAVTINGQSGSGSDTHKVVKSKSPPVRNHVKTRSPSRSSFSVRKRNWDAQLRAQEEARATAARAEEEERGREQVWYVATVMNRTDEPIVYEYSCGDSWKKTTVEPGEGWTHTRRDRAVRVKFERGPSGETKEYCLTSLKIVGHKPTEAEKQEAKINFFKPRSDGNLELFAER